MKILNTRIFEKKSKYHLNVIYEVPTKLNWYYAPVFVAFWAMLYYALVLNIYLSLPDPLMVKDEANLPDRFIAQRAQFVLLGLTNLGPRVVGSEVNEVATVNFLLNEIEKVRAQASDYFEIETDVQEASGNYIHWDMVNMYQGVQNVVAKLSANGSTSESYLLINSHFDSFPGSVGASDDGIMVAVMLEVMRVISKSNGPLQHPIVFLFNGAEENPLQASHAFITQHKWAKNCKAVINLDAGGNGGKEMIFQSGPKHPWIMKHYREKAMHPFALTVAEEMFQANLIPSDTDFRIFRDYGGVPGIDLAFLYNGYVYHSKYDRYNSLSIGSLQNVGDNILAVAKSIANSQEMYNTSKYKDGHIIFYDLFGLFMILYTQTVSTIINVVVCCVGLFVIAVSMFFMVARPGLGVKDITKRFGFTFGLQILSIVLGTVLSFLVAVFLDRVDRSMTWFSESWLIFGLYFCPMVFGMSILPAIYSQYMKRDELSLGFRIQMFMHAQCVFLILMTIILTCLEVRSAFLFTLAVFFDIFALIINLITKWHRKAYLFAITVIVCQILPFIYFTSVFYVFIYSQIPMMGRNGSNKNPDLLIAALTILVTILSTGFLVPLMLFFRKARILISVFFVTTILLIIIAVTPAGFPYTPVTANQRFSLMHIRRILHDNTQAKRISNSGIYVYPQDRRTHTVDDIVPEMRTKEKISNFCKTEMFCGMPLYNHRWSKAREHSFWIEFSAPNLPSFPTLELLSKEHTTNITARFNYKLTGPDHMGIFIGIKNDAKVISWTFNDTMIRDKWKQPYFIYFSYGKDSTPLNFFVEVEKPSGNLSESSIEIGIGAHWVHHNISMTKEFQEFLDTFPTWAVITSWVASYESWVY